MNEEDKLLSSTLPTNLLLFWAVNETESVWERKQTHKQSQAKDTEERRARRSPAQAGNAAKWGRQQRERPGDNSLSSGQSPALTSERTWGCWTLQSLGWDMMSQADLEHKYLKSHVNSWLAADLILPVGSEKHWPSSALRPGALCAALREKQQLKSLLGARRVCEELYTVSCKRGRRKDQAWGTASYLSQPLPKILFQKSMLDNSSIQCYLKGSTACSEQKSMVQDKTQRSAEHRTQFSNQVASAQG